MYSANAAGMPIFETIRGTPSAIWYKFPHLAWQMRTAFANIASKTGSSSPGDELMT